MAGNLSETVSGFFDVYNDDGHRWIDEVYGPEVKMVIPGAGVCTDDKESLHRAEDEFRRAVPDVRAELVALHECNDGVAVIECVLRWTDRATGEASESWYCAICEFENEKIVSEVYYLDKSTFPAIDSVLARLT
ncbi:nuclear transport factor 2 family protein [Mycobacteroides abscessus]|uniref:nuclear transport factor 2 family protein n=1 Tax=Mycobacteroides abscessus TaxID=36809 RepID=UPI0012FFF7AD|nr:nuclear transport factor 2 family protein [Mycobacteroides abscessus]